MKKILYLMHVDWDWIKQRPHFIAEGLSDYFDVTVLFDYSWHRKILKKVDNPKNLKLIPLYHLPKSNSFPILNKLFIFFRKLKIKNILMKDKFDFIYVPFPTYQEILPKNFAGKIIYDCMDRYSSFQKDKRIELYIKCKEKKLIDAADFIFASSQNLKEFLKQEYKVNDNKITVLRNAFNNNILKIENKQTKKDKFTICYFGTISFWFDFDLIKKSLEDFDFIEYLFVGPIESGIKTLQHPRIKYTGAVNHSDLYNYTRNADCFIMPFVLNDLIKAVDPVKLYEYINFEKNIICIHYEEVERFELFVYFYQDYESFKNVIGTLYNDNRMKYTKEQKEKFLIDNTWEKRCESLYKVINLNE